MRSAVRLFVFALALPLASLAHAQQAGLFARMPLARTITALTSPQARVRLQAAERLALIGPHDRIADPLRVAIEHEAVPEVLSAMLGTLARRAEASDLPALEGAWDHASILDRRIIASSMDAMEGVAPLPFLRRHLVSEGASARVCAALVRNAARVSWLAATLDDPASRDRVVSCLASAEPSAARDAALVRAGLDLEPMSAREVLTALAHSEAVSDAAVALAVTALDRSDATLSPAALALLARHAPERLSVERWQTWIAGEDDRAASAVRALLVLAPSIADEALARLRAADMGAARRGLAVLLDRDEVVDLPRIARFADVRSVRAAVLDALAAREGGAGVLETLPPASDVDLAIALAHPTGEVRAALLARTTSLTIRALLGEVSARQCTETDALHAAHCLAFTDGAQLAASALETERDPNVVAWLAFASRDRAVSASTIHALLDDAETRPAALSIAAAAIAAASPADRRALETRIVRATTDLDEIVRAEAIRVLGVLARPLHRGAVLRALEDPSMQVRLAAAGALASVGIDRTDLRVTGHLHVEPGDRVLARLRDEGLTMASDPLHVRVVEHDPEAASTAVITVLLADGRSLRLPPVDGELLLPGVPDAPAIVQLGSRSGPSRH